MRASGLQADLAMPLPNPGLIYVIFTFPSQAEAAMEKSRAHIRDAVLIIKWLFLLFCVFAIGPSAVYPEKNGLCGESGIALGIDFEGGLLEGQAHFPHRRESRTQHRLGMSQGIVCQLLVEVKLLLI